MVDCFNRPRPNTVLRETIESRTLNNLTDDYSTESDFIGFMKVDIEGYEYYMFQEAKEFLDTH